MRDSLAILGTVAHKTVISLRRDLSLLRDWVYSNQSEIVSIVGTLYAELQKYRNAVHMLSEVTYLCLKQIFYFHFFFNIYISYFSRLFSLVVQQLGAKDDQIKGLYFKISEIENEQLARDETEKLEKARFQEEISATVRKEKELAVKEVTEKLAHAHKEEIDLLRQRLKLLTFANAEHSPGSDSGQERVEVKELTYLFFRPTNRCVDSIFY